MHTLSESEPDHLALKNSELGRFVSDRDCQVLATIMRVHVLADGEALVRAGAEDHALCVVVRGNLQVCTLADGREMIVHVMKPGDWAGIRNFVARTPRQVGLRAKGPTTVYTIRPDDFELLLDSHPRLVYNFMRGLFCLLDINLERMHRDMLRLALASANRV